MKKTYLLGLALLLTAGALGACSNNDNKKPKDLEFTTNEIGGFTKRAIGDSKDVPAEFGTRFSNDIYTRNNVDYIRILYPVKGEFKSLEYSAVVSNYSEETYKTEVKEVYKAYKQNNTLIYANKTTGTNDKNNSEDWYWACLDVVFNVKDTYRDNTVKVVLSGEDKNNNKFTTTELECSFNQIKSRLSYYWGDGSEEEQAMLPWSYEGGWQFQNGDVNANMDVNSVFGFVYVDTDNGSHDFSFVGTVGDGNTYAFECYHGGRVYLNKDGDAMNLNIGEGCDEIKWAFSGCGDVITFFR